MMLLWVTAGKGKHRIDFERYEMLPGYLFFINQGQIHEVIEFPDDGWIVMFDESLLTDFLSTNRYEELLNMMDSFSQMPFNKISQSRLPILNDLFYHLNTILDQVTPDFKLAQPYVLLMLLYAYGQYLNDQKGNYLRSANNASIRILKALI